MRITEIFFIYILLFVLNAIQTTGQVINYKAVKAKVDFNHHLQEWDGFGINYVETSQTFDYDNYPQDYGSLSLLDTHEQDSIIQMVFGNNGLKVNLVKMFLDPLHQSGPKGDYDHETTTQSMREFVKSGVQLTRERNKELTIITTLYGPPAYITKQKVFRGRDLDPSHKNDLVDYFVDWAKYLIKEDFPVKYISLHNEGESWLRWPEDGGLGTAHIDGHDYNFFWPPHQVNEFIKLLREALDQEGLKDVGVTNGEPTNWYRFVAWGYAQELVQDKEVMEDLAMVTSHGFYVGSTSSPRWFGPHTSRGIEMVRKIKPGIKAWVTSTSWNTVDRCVINRNGKAEKAYVMDAGFVREIHGNIYESKVNGLIPWALMQNASFWKNPDPNPGCAFRVYDDGTFEVEKAYYYYKQVSRAGQAGMKVAYTEAMDSEIAIIAFASDNTDNSDAFVLVNLGDETRKVAIEVKGVTTTEFETYRTSGVEKYVFRRTAEPIEQGTTENYLYLGSSVLENDELIYEAPANSVTTFFAN